MNMQEKGQLRQSSREFVQITGNSSRRATGERTLDQTQSMARKDGLANPAN